MYGVFKNVRKCFPTSYANNSSIRLKAYTSIRIKMIMECIPERKKEKEYYEQIHGWDDYSAWGKSKI